MSTLVTPDFDHYPSGQRPTRLQWSADSLVVDWDDGHVSTYPSLWLREFSPDLSTHNVETRERSIAVIDLPEGLSISSAEIEPDGSILVTFQPENFTSRYHPGWLRTHCLHDPRPLYRLPDRILWTSGSDDIPPTFDGTGIAGSDTFGAWVNALHTHGVGLIQNLDVEPGTLESIVERIGPIRTSNFGRIFDVRLIRDSNSNAYTSQSLRAHTDLSTREYQPGLQFFFCMENSVTGGTTVLSDGFAIAEKLRTTHPEHFRLLAGTPIPFVNTDRDTEYRFEVPLLETDRSGQLTTVRFTYWLRAPMSGDVETINHYYEALRQFHHYADQDEFQIRFEMQPGELLGIDNRRVLHGRTGFDESTGSRWLRGCYMEREEVESRLRILDRQKRAPGRT